MGDERRQAERVRMALEMRWDGLSGHHVARIYDLSLTGCYIETLAQVTNGEQIRFEIQLRDGRWLMLQGEVAHAHPMVGFGVRLTDLSPADRATLATLLGISDGPADAGG